LSGRKQDMHDMMHDAVMSVLAIINRVCSHPLMALLCHSRHWGNKR
jgi:hypothetical protein